MRKIGYRPNSENISIINISSSANSVTDCYVSTICQSSEEMLATSNPMISMNSKQSKHTANHFPIRVETGYFAPC